MGRWPRVIHFAYIADENVLFVDSNRMTQHPGLRPSVTSASGPWQRYSLSIGIDVFKPNIGGTFEELRRGGADLARTGNRYDTKQTSRGQRRTMNILISDNDPTLVVRRHFNKYWSPQ
jgi:hypothetical protein